MKKQDLLKDKRILLVDDEPDVLDTLVDLLPSAIRKLRRHYEDAQDKLISGKFDMAILDIMGVDGYKLLDLATERNITAVMLTAHALSPEDTIKSHKKVPPIIFQRRR